MERGVASQAAQPDRLIVIDVPLADFEEATAGREDGQSLLEEWAWQRIENNVDTAALRHRHDAVGEAQRTGVEDMRNPELMEVGPLLGAAGGGDDLSAVSFGDRHRRQSDPAGRRGHADGVGWAPEAGPN